MTDEEMTRTAQRTLRTFLKGEKIGYNNALEWAAKWIESSICSDETERTKEFALNMAMSIRAHKRKN